MSMPLSPEPSANLDSWGTWIDDENDVQATPTPLTRTKPNHELRSASRSTRTINKLSLCPRDIPRTPKPESKHGQAFDPFELPFLSRANTLYDSATMFGDDFEDNLETFFSQMKEEHDRHRGIERRNSIGSCMSGDRTLDHTIQTAPQFRRRGSTGRTLQRLEQDSRSLVERSRQRRSKSVTSSRKKKSKKDKKHHRSSKSKKTRDGFAAQLEIPTGDYTNQLDVTYLAVSAANSATSSPVSASKSLKGLSALKGKLIDSPLTSSSRHTVHSFDGMEVPYVRKTPTNSAA